MVGMLSNDLNISPLAYIGLGLLNSSGPSTQPRPLAAGLLQGLQMAQQGQALQNQNKLQGMLAEKTQMDLAQAKDRQAALAGLFGGYDPQSGITWQTGRQASVPDTAGLAEQAGATAAAGAGDPAQSQQAANPTPSNPGPANPMAGQMGMLARAFPEQMAGGILKGMMPRDPVKLGQGESLVDPRTGKTVVQGQVAPVKVGQGESLVDPVTGKRVFDLPAKPEFRTSFDAQGREIVVRVNPDGSLTQVSGSKTDLLSPGAMEQKLGIAAAGRNQITIDQRADNEFEKNYGKGLSERALTDLSAADAARKSIAQLDRLQALTSDFQTGKLAPAKATVAAWAQDLGVDPAKLGLDPNAAINAQGVEAITNAMTVGQIGAGGFPANNFSNADRTFLQKTVPQIGNTPGGNAIISQAMRQGLERSIEKEQQWLSAREQGKSYEQFMQSWNKYIKDTPVFPKIDSQANFAMLRSGTVFTAPDGSVRVKP